LAEGKIAPGMFILIDTGCDPALPRNCVDHPADCNLFENMKLLNSQ